MPIPTINTSAELIAWQQSLKATTKTVITPRIPWNFTVSNKQGGNYLTWQAVGGADGYRVDISTNGDFSTGVNTVTLRGQANTAYFDTVPIANGTTPSARQYRVRATAGTITEPQKVDGINTGVVTSTAIPPNNTTTSSTSQVDTTTTQASQAKTGNGNYHSIQKGF